MGDCRFFSHTLCYDKDKDIDVQSLLEIIEHHNIFTSRHASYAKAVKKDRNVLYAHLSYTLIDDRTLEKACANVAKFVGELDLIV